MEGTRTRSLALFLRLGQPPAHQHGEHVSEAVRSDELLAAGSAVGQGVADGAQSAYLVQIEQENEGEVHSSITDRWTDRLADRRTG